MFSWGLITENPYQKFIILSVRVLVRCWNALGTGLTAGIQSAAKSIPRQSLEINSVRTLPKLFYVNTSWRMRNLNLPWDYYGLRENVSVKRCFYLGCSLSTDDECTFRIQEAHCVEQEQTIEWRVAVIVCTLWSLLKPCHIYLKRDKVVIRQETTFLTTAREA